ncbi:hypothetical protein BOTU111921_27690 [Bordetella tumbae]
MDRCWLCAGLGLLPPFGVGKFLHINQLLITNLLALRAALHDLPACGIIAAHLARPVDSYLSGKPYDS